MKSHINMVSLFLISSIITSAHAQTRFSSAPSGGERHQPQPPDQETLLGALCEADAAIPDDLIQCGSCNNRCGLKSDSDVVPLNSDRVSCSCDKFCGFHGDCCQDFRGFCQNEYMEFQDASTKYSSTQTHGDFECKNFGSYWSNLVIHTCPDGSMCEFRDDLNEDVNTFVPMYDIHRGVHYVSWQCAVCNGARDVKPWNVTLNCKETEGQIDQNTPGVIDSEQGLDDVIATKACVIKYSAPMDPRPCYYGPVISTCPTSCGNRNLVQFCESGHQSLTTLGGLEVYRNVYCAVCNSHDKDTADNLSCGLSTNSAAGPGMKEKPSETRDFGSFSLTLVFDFDPREGLTIGEHPSPDCPTGQIYVPAEHTCRPRACPSGFVLDGLDCIPEPSNITAIITGTFSVEPTIQMIDTLHQDKVILETNIQNNVADVLDTFNVTYNDLVFAIQLNNTDTTITTRIAMTCSCHFQSIQQNGETTAQKFENTYRREVSKEVIQYIFERNIHLTPIIVNVDFQLVTVTALHTQDMECTWLVYQLNETKSGNGNITVVSTGKTYSLGMFQVLNDDVIVCETDLGVTEMSIDDIDLPLSIVTLICVGISIICLIVRIIMQFRITSFKNRPGKLQIQLTLAFLLAFVILIVGPFLSAIPEACTTAAILMAYGFLAAFIWMNVIAVDTWLVFRPSSAFSRSDEEQRLLIVHYVLGWGIPVILVTPSVVLNYVDTGYVYMKPEFGGSRCWYTQRYAMLIYFGIPIATSILVNICLYIITSINLHRAFKNATSVIRAEGYHFGIYVRLFILMGITWIFGFISAFTDQIVVDFIFVIVTSLQGLFLFVSFVWNKRAMSDIRKRKSSESSSFSQRRTKSTPVHSDDSNGKNDMKM